MSYYEQDPVRYTTAFDGVAEVVARLDRLGLKQGVCTNKFEKSARMILEGLKLMPPIADVAGADTFTVRKPDPGHILQLIDKIGGNRARAVMIGDSIHDVEAAHRGGLPAVLVSWGYTARPASELGAEAVIDRFDALPEALGRDCRPLTGSVDGWAGRPYTRPFRALSSAGEHTLHTGGVVGSIPTAPTIPLAHAGLR